MLARDVSWFVMALGVVLGAVPTASDAAVGEPAGGADAERRSVVRYAGRPLSEALLALDELGLEILFTSQVVRPEMRVESEPAGDTPREILDRLLEPHGLEAREGPGGRLVVVPRPATATAVRGRVRGRFDARPLADVQVLMPEAGLETTSGEDGGFELIGVPAGIHTVEARRPGFVVERLAGVEIGAGQVREVVFELVSAPVPLDEIVVTPSLISLLRSEPVPRIALERDEIAALPHLGDDLFRALTLLPGITAQEFSARFNVRGGRTDEVLVMLDQLELFEPYHLRDFSSALSFVAPQAIAEVDLILGGFPAPFGDRMGGVLDMRTVEPADHRTHLGLSIIGAQVGGSGPIGERRGNWLGVARFGSLELAKDFVGAEVQPVYWDAFAKAELQLGPRHRLGARLLHGDDDLDTVISEGEDLERTHTDWRSSYLWLTHRALLGTGLFVDSVVSRGRIDRDRRATETQADELEFLVRDRRRLDVTGFKQDWNLQPGRDGPGDRLYARWGFDLRRLDTDYDYANDFETDPLLDALRGGPQSATTRFLEGFRGEQYSVYLSNRWRLRPRLTAELGLRYDEHTVPGDRDLSPRVNLVAALGERSTLRAAWGHYFQSQRLYELQVEDGETRFFPSERTEQFGLGFEHALAGGSTLRLDLYHRDVTNPRPRFENVFEPVDPFPEIQPDRIRIAADRAAAQGVELFLRGRPRRKLDWWINYTWSRAEDEIDGRDVPRGFDQPHALNADVSLRIDDHWSINLAFRYHTGWPTTAVSGALEEDDEGDLRPVPVFGPLSGDRLSDYHRLDFRLSRRWRLKKGELALFVDVQNLYDRENLAGFDVEIQLEVGEDGRVAVIPVREVWAGILPSFGIDWAF